MPRLWGFSLYRLLPEFRRLEAEHQEHLKEEFAQFLARWQEKEGFLRVYSLVGLLGRVSGALVGLSFALLGPLFGYVSGENPGPNPGLAFRFLISVVPGVAILLAYLLTAFFPHEVRE
ncbi:hypothetical protein CSW37_00880 [Thermus scotoductus]|uniref:MFS transporter n=1 Tax=Thermus scotoductus TaxID=37636 RepID=A0A430SHW8_THESC|nr:hypothetical protein CSW37_00880 [Thermus scotoductus]